MLRLTILFLILLAFSAAAFDRETPAYKADTYSNAQAANTISLRQ
ncbi:MAG: hypothetical protein OEX83_09150 [Gammaproteobacteria bacterium]|nr:hypothetical protein [Gammaproteobacteria bacterium]